MSLLSLYHLSQALLTSYTGLLSYTSITKVQTYESKTEKLAQYSNVAESHLRTTRTTMTAGAVSVLSSLTASLYLLTTSRTKPGVSATLSVVLAVGMTAAHTHISNYWRGKAKVPAPGAGDYNDAITTSNQMRSLVGGLAGSWAVVAVWYFFVWIS